jgi:hypothetical protein
LISLKNYAAVQKLTADALACLLLAQSGHLDTLNQCPLLGVKRTSQFAGVMSASDPKRIFMHRIKTFRYSITSSHGSFIEVWRSHSLSMKLGGSLPLLRPH